MDKDFNLVFEAKLVRLNEKVVIVRLNEKVVSRGVFKTK